MNDNASTKLLSYEQAAAYLALPIGRLRRLVKLRRIAHFRYNATTVRFSREDLDLWLTGGDPVLSSSHGAHRASPEHEAAIVRLAPTADRALFADTIQARFGLELADRNVVPDAYLVDEETRTLVLYEVEHRHPIDAYKLRRVRDLRDALAVFGWSVTLLAAHTSSNDWTELDIETGSLSAAECMRIAKSGIGPRFEMPKP